MIQPNKAVKQLHVGEMIDKAKQSLDRALAKVELIKERIDILEDVQSQLNTKP